jgi:SAM-dependent methyltransferase
MTILHTVTAADQVHRNTTKMPVRTARKRVPVDCPVCGPKSSQLFGVSNELQIVRCDGCSMLRVSERPSVEDVSDFYRDEYISHTERAEAEMISYREGSLRREANRLRRFVPEGGRLLDIGAATGSFLSQFSGHTDWTVEGVEPSAFAVEYARKRFGLKIHHGFLGDQSFDDESFDVVTSLDTLMLHPYPSDDVGEMARILKPGGLLAVEIPGLTFRLLKQTGPVSKLIYGDGCRLNAGVHLYFFNRRTLTQMVAQHGFEPVQSWPESAPVYGHWISKAGKWMFYQATRAGYSITGSRFQLAPKEFIIFRKQVA